MAGESTAAGFVHGPRVHDIGAGGVVSISVEADDVRIRGVDGTEARVVAPADGAGIETDGSPGRLTVRTAGGTRASFLGIRIGGRAFGVHVSGTIELEVPRDARVEVSSAAGDVALRDVRGGAQVRTVSGDVSIKEAAGRLAIDVASGDVTVTGAEPVSLDVHAVSGDVRARAPRFDRVAIETISGDAEIGGTFGAEAGHVITTVSGDVELTVLGGLTVEIKTVSGDVSCDHPDRREGDGRRRPLVIGDGAARLAIRSMSGDVEIRAGTPGTARGEHGADDVGAARFGFPPVPPLPPLPPLPPMPGRPVSAAPAARPAPPASPSASPPVEEAAADSLATLAVLEALERGEIDVVEAERRLPGAPAAAEATPDA